MKILILGNGSWDNTNSLGNTLSNWFEGWDDCEFAFMYNREAMPNNIVCKKYFSISPSSLIRNVFRPSKIGKSFLYDYTKKVDSIDNETATINKTQGWKRTAAKFVVDTLFLSKLWFNDNVRKFIDEFNPDIVFSFCIADSYRYNILKYIKTKSRVKIIYFVADDIYGAYCNGSGVYNRIYKNRLPHMFSMADKVYCASIEMCDRYNLLFGCEAAPLFKGCNLCTPKQSISNPIKITYAGNLLYGRDKTLGDLAKAISELNQDGFKIQLNIYSNTFIDEKKDKLLNIPGSSKLCGCRPFAEIQEILRQSDIVLHVESFDEKQIELVRYSFSTKIIDCLQSGSAMMVIGPSGISSVEYTSKINGTIVINDIKDIVGILRSIVSVPKSLVDNAFSINQYAIEYHEIMNVRNKLRSEIKSLLNTN